MPSYVGIDWGSRNHALCIVDEAGRVRLRKEVSHDRSGLARMLAVLNQEAYSEKLAIAIERPNGLLVDTLFEAGHQVVPVAPRTVKASRSRYRACGSKSDQEDAYILADVLRTDGHRLQALRPHSDELRALRALTRTRDDLVGLRGQVSNQLRALLENSWPGATTLFYSLHSPIALAFLKRYPTSSKARCLGAKRMAKFLNRQGYSGSRSAQALVQHLNDAAQSSVGPVEEQTNRQLVLSLVAVLDSLCRQRGQLDKAIESAVEASAWGQIIMSFPRAGRINAAQILAEIGDDPARFQTESQLAAHAGVAPVTFASGAYKKVACRRACNKRLRRAITTWAGNSRHASPWAKQRYDAARKRGCRHPHAVRILARAWIRVLWHCLQNQEHYDPAKHTAAANLADQHAT